MQIVIVTFYKTTATPVNTRFIAYLGLFLAVPAVWLISMGIGSIKARRWARALLLISSWYGFIVGISAFIFYIYDKIAQGAQIYEDKNSTWIWFMLVVFIIVPGILILFYGSKNVKATCEFRNPQISWTDKCPLPVLALSFIYVYMAGSMLSGGSNSWAIPFFGYVLDGVVGAGISIVGFFLYCYMIWGAYKLNIKAWWCAVLVTIASTVSGVVTFLRVDSWNLYQKMIFSEQQLEHMRQAVSQSTTVLSYALWGATVLGYLLYTRRYFVSPFK
jgi:hypothetical protein